MHHLSSSTICVAANKGHALFGSMRNPEGDVVTEPAYSSATAKTIWRHEISSQDAQNYNEVFGTTNDILRGGVR